MRVERDPDTPDHLLWRLPSELDRTVARVAVKESLLRKDVPNGRTLPLVSLEIATARALKATEAPVEFFLPDKPVFTDWIEGMFIQLSVETGELRKWPQARNDLHVALGVQTRIAIGAMADPLLREYKTSLARLRSNNATA